MPTLPYLLQDLTPEQRIRILALDYVTESRMVPPDFWLSFSDAVTNYISSGKFPESHANQPPQMTEEQVEDLHMSVDNNADEGPHPHLRLVVDNTKNSNNDEDDKDNPDGNK